MKYPFLTAIAQRSADLLGLTLAGATRLAPYDDEVHTETFLSYIGSAAFKLKKINDPLKYYMYFCNQYCKSHFLDPNLSLITQLLRKHNLSLRDELIYIPESERVKIDLPQEKNNKAYDKPGKEEKSPYRLVTHPWKKSAKAFKFSVSGGLDNQGVYVPRKLDEIAEAIKLVGYRAIGIEGKTVLGVPEACGFVRNAELVIAENKAKGIKYNINWPHILELLYEFVNYSIDKWHQDLDKDAAILKCTKAMADFIPVILKF